MVDIAQIKDTMYEMLIAAARHYHDNRNKASKLVPIPKPDGGVKIPLDDECEHQALDVLVRKHPDMPVFFEEHQQGTARNLIHEIGGFPEGINSEWQNYTMFGDLLDGSGNASRRKSPVRHFLGLEDSEGMLLAMALAYGGAKEDRLYTAERGRGVTLNGKPIWIRDRNPLEGGEIGFHFPGAIDYRNAAFFLAMHLPQQRVEIPAVRSGLAHILYLLEGGEVEVEDVKFRASQAYINIHIMPWDGYAPTLFISEAGGKATDVFDREVKRNSISLVADNGVVHPDLMKITGVWSAKLANPEGLKTYDFTQHFPNIDAIAQAYTRLDESDRMGSPPPNAPYDGIDRRKQ